MDSAHSPISSIIVIDSPEISIDFCETHSNESTTQTLLFDSIGYFSHIFFPFCLFSFFHFFCTRFFDIVKEKNEPLTFSARHNVSKLNCGNDSAFGSNSFNSNRIVLLWPVDGVDDKFFEPPPDIVSKCTRFGSDIIKFIGTITFY